MLNLILLSLVYAADPIFEITPQPRFGTTTTTTALPEQPLVTMEPPAATPIPLGTPIDPFVESEVLLVTVNGRRLSSLVSKGLGFACAYFQYQKGTVIGAKDAIVGAVEGVWSIATHPVDTVVNIVYAGTHPKETAIAIAASIKAYCTKDGNFDPLAMGKCVGNAATQIGLLVLPGAGEANEINVVAKGAEIGEAADISAGFSEMAKLLENLPICAPVGVRFKRAEELPCIVKADVPVAATHITESTTVVAPAAAKVAQSVTELFTEYLAGTFATPKYVTDLNAEFLLDAERSTGTFAISAGKKTLGAIEPVYLKEMEALVEPITAPGPRPYRGTVNAEINSWQEALSASTKDKVELTTAYKTYYKLTDNEVTAVNAWTKEGAGYIIDPVNLPAAFEKMPAYEGMIVRNQAIDLATEKSLEAALASGEPIPMKSFVNNAKSSAPTKPVTPPTPPRPNPGGVPPPPPPLPPGGLPKGPIFRPGTPVYDGPNVLAASPGGYGQYSTGLSGRIVIKSKTIHHSPI